MSETHLESRRILLFGYEWMAIDARTEAGVDYLLQWLARVVIRSLDTLVQPTQHLTVPEVAAALREQHVHAVAYWQEPVVRAALPLEYLGHPPQFWPLWVRRRFNRFVDCIGSVIDLAGTATVTFPIVAQAVRAALLDPPKLVDHMEFTKHCQQVQFAPFAPQQAQVQLLHQQHREVIFSPQLWDSTITTQPKKFVPVERTRKKVRKPKASSPFM